MRGKPLSHGTGPTMVLVLLGILSPGAPEATMVVAPMGLENLARASDVVVHGQVESIAYAVEGHRVFTYVSVGVREMLKGTSPARNVLLRQYGGRHGGRYTFVVGSPRIRTGEEVVLFLRADRASTYGIVGLAEGKFDVVRSGRDATVRRHLRGMGYLRPGTEARFPESLEDLKAAVRAAEN